MQYSTKYRLVRREILAAVGDTITVQNMREFRYLMIICNLFPSGDILPVIRFNGDSGANYSYRRSGNGGADATTISDAEIELAGGSLNSEFVLSIYVYNPNNEQKIITVNCYDRGAGLGAANIGNRRETTGKWANTTVPIDRIDVINTDAGSFAAGSELIVLALHSS